jgi:hypothetical protein
MAVLAIFTASEMSPDKQLEGLPDHRETLIVKANQQAVNEVVNRFTIAAILDPVRFVHGR